MKRIFIDAADGSKSVLEILNEKGIYINADCGGNGRCGKCKIMKNGQWDLACRMYPEEPVEIFVPQHENEILVEISMENIKADGSRNGNLICIDIGTTTVAAAYAEAATGKVLNCSTCVNHQRSFGSDVISRIDAANKGQGERMKQSIRRDVKNLMNRLLQNRMPCPVIITGNTTMEHLFMGYSCESLGTAPYTPYDIGLKQEEEFTLLPGISGFVGADLVCGILNCGMDQSDQVVALVDLGTNGEMAIGNKEKIYTASTAAGPAFEGGNISCGMASVPGAVSEVEIQEGHIEVRTINGAEAIGICGTGIIDLTAELVKAEIADETGLLREEYFDTGISLSSEVRFIQKDIREVQMAKAAVRAGLETLAKEYGIDTDEISTLYIAGGFGKKMNVANAVRIGMFPKALEEKIVAIGNSSLAGAIQFGCTCDGEARVLEICRKAKEIDLARSRYFNDLYMNAMYFEAQ